MIVQRAAELNSVQHWSMTPLFKLDILCNKMSLTFQNHFPFLWNPTANCHFHKIPALFCALFHVNKLTSSYSVLLNLLSQVIGSGSFPRGFAMKALDEFPSPLVRDTCPVNLISFDFITHTTCAKVHTLWHPSLLFSLSQYYIIPPRPIYYIQHFR
jgi:hypothetical protein